MIDFNGYQVYHAQEILNRLQESIKNKKPFSLIRFGDGGIKLLHSIFYYDLLQLKSIIEREGLPDIDSIPWLLNLWGKHSRQADFIDTPEVYFSSKFWPKYKKNFKPMGKKTIDRMRMWKDLYSRAEMDNVNYCNPEVNYLFCVKRWGKKTILDVIKDKKICIICACPEVKSHIPFDVDIWKICKHYENQYENYFKITMEFIENNSEKYDVFLVAAGELGRLYSGYIKECHGRSVDMGFMIDYWNNGEIPVRMNKFVEQHPTHKLLLKLTSFGNKYSRYL